MSDYSNITKMADHLFPDGNIYVTPSPDADTLISSINGYKVKCADLRELKDKKIGCIKEFHAFTNMGLKDSKNAVETIPLDGNNNMRPDKIVELFEKYAVKIELSKEELLQIFSDALDVADKMYFRDPIAVIMTTCINIQKIGGVNAIALQVHNFINNL